MHELTLHVEPGEVFGFIGPNGAGKSTAIRALLGLSRPTGGAASVHGIDLAKDRDRKREALAHVGYVPSEPGVYPGKTVAETLAYLGGFHAADTRALRAKLCERIDLDVTRRADELSLGNKKKLAIVAAMHHAPSVLVLDEPSSGLDPLVKHELFALLAEVAREGAAVFFSSHVISEVESVCDRFALLKEGRLAQLVRTQDLLREQPLRVRATFADPTDSVLLSLTDARPNAAGELEWISRVELPALLQALAQDTLAKRITKVVLEHPSLEELVLRQYAKERAQ